MKERDYVAAALPCSWRARTSSSARRIYPGIAIMLTALAFNLTGDGIRDWTQ